MKKGETWIPLWRTTPARASAELGMFARALHCLLHMQVDGNGRIDATVRGDDLREQCKAMAKTIAANGLRKRNEIRMCENALYELATYGAVAIDDHGLTLYSLDECTAGEPVKPEEDEV